MRELMYNTITGAMGSYVAFYLAGLYPVPGTRQFLLSSPFFPEISFFNPVFGKTTTIKSKNFKGNPADGTAGTVFVKVTFHSPVELLLSLMKLFKERENRRKTLEIKLFLRLDGL